MQFEEQAHEHARLVDWLTPDPGKRPPIFPYIWPKLSIDVKALLRERLAYADYVKLPTNPYQESSDYYDDAYEEREDEPDRYIPLSGKRQLLPQRELTAAGWINPKDAPRNYIRPAVTHVKPDSWVDTETGEIYTANNARRNGVKLPPHRSDSLRYLYTQTRLGECTPTERSFVTAVLKLRNNRGGLVVKLDTIIDEWIARNHPNIRSTDKARKAKQLASILDRRNIMANDQTLHRDLQRRGKLTNRDIIEEGRFFYTVFPLKAKAGRNLLEWKPATAEDTPLYQPAWMIGYEIAQAATVSQ